MQSEEDELMLAATPQPNSATLNAVAEKAMKARDLELEITSLEERLKERRAALQTIYHIELPSLMDQANTDRVGIPAAGNMPAYDIRLIPYYRANIAVSWPPERQALAFEALADIGAADLIKTAITIALPREARQEAQELVQALTQSGYHLQIKESVHHGTLTAWLKEQVERGNPLPSLDIIGAEVGRVAKMTERR